MKKEIAEGSFFLRFIEKCMNSKPFEGSLFFQYIFSLLSRCCAYIKAIENKEMLLFFFILSSILTFFSLTLFFTITY